MKITEHLSLTMKNIGGGKREVPMTVHSDKQKSCPKVAEKIRAMATDALSLNIKKSQDVTASMEKLLNDGLR